MKWKAVPQIGGYVIYDDDDGYPPLAQDPTHSQKSNLHVSHFIIILNNNFISYGKYEYLSLIRSLIPKVENVMYHLVK